MLDRGVLGLAVLALGTAVVYLYKELKTERSNRLDDQKQHSKTLSEIQAAFVTTVNDLYEQRLSDKDVISDRFLSLFTSNAEMQERNAQAFQRIEKKLDEANDARRKARDE